MKSNSDTELYLSTIVREGMYSNESNLRTLMRRLFEGIDFKGKNVLDIGGGKGLFSFYAACKGAKNVVCLEPEADGSSFGMIKAFGRLKVALGQKNVSLNVTTLQSFDPAGETYDIVLLHDSINHLDEAACISLHCDIGARLIYKEIFQKIFNLTHSGGKIIICDCSPYNLFAMLKLGNPFAPTIEWHKHQPPEIWVSIMSEVGFVNPRIRWSSFNRLKRLGQVLIGNKTMAFFLFSHFCLTMDK